MNEVDLKLNLYFLEFFLNINSLFLDFLYKHPLFLIFIYLCNGAWHDAGDLKRRWKNILLQQ